MTIYFLTIYFPNGPRRLRAKEGDRRRRQEGFFDQKRKRLQFFRHFFIKIRIFLRN